MGLIDRVNRYVFFTGKGGVGKTSVACATALELAARGRRVLLVSTDPASNLDEVLGTPLGSSPVPVRDAPRLFALNIDPVAAAAAYRERVVGPYRGLLPDASIRSIEEQLSGACTVEIAAFDEFSKLLGDRRATADFDHVIFDTAPTGHTLRLLELPAAWTHFLEAGQGGTSCLGPLAGMKDQQGLYAASRNALVDGAATMLVLVSRADDASLAEAERTHRELDSLGVRRQELVLNGLFSARGSDDPVAQAFEAVARAAVARAPSGVASLPRTELPLFPYELVGIPALRTLLGTQHLQPLESAASHGAEQMGPSFEGLDALVPDIAALGHGAVMTMGKGGVGKTSVAVAVATMLAERGHRVHLTTTDPAGHAFEVSTPNLRVSRIDPAAETAAYRESVLATASSSLDEAGRALLEEDLRSPCTEEVAVFRAFARTIEQGEQGFVVIDTAPTGHTLLLLDAAETYHREVLRTAGETTDDVRRLLPRLRDAHFTHILIVTLPEATPVHEAASLQRDLARADIHPFAWVVNQSLSPLVVSEPVLSARRAGERRYLNEVRGLAQRIALVPWIAALTQQPIGDQSKGSPAVAPEAHQQQ